MTHARQDSQSAAHDAATQNAHPFAEFTGHLVVLDTQGPLIYIGTLERILPNALLLIDTDVHDINDSRAGKELYLMETRELGVRINRARVIVHLSQVASVSRLADVRN